MNSTPFSERFTIGIFGKCNSGKSTLLNKLTNQNISIVSEKKGTTTDPVFKAIEISKLGPCVLIDTPGFDDFEKNIGKKRSEKTFEVLNYVNAAILISKNSSHLDKLENNILKMFKLKKIPIILILNNSKTKIKKNNTNIDENNLLNNVLTLKLNIKTDQNINILLNKIATFFIKFKEKESYLIYDLINPKDLVVLVIVIDESYPKARLIMPQQQLINEILKKGAFCYVLKNTEYEYFSKKIKIKPNLIVVDSQIFDEISKKTENEIKITSFSILMARKKGVLKTAIEGCKTLEKIKDYDKILICESCTHKKNSCDLGSVKIPNLIEKYTNKKLIFEFKTGLNFTKNPNQYALIIHCGGCMSTSKQIQARFDFCTKNNVPITNYGILLAYLNNILKKSTWFLKN